MPAKFESNIRSFQGAAFDDKISRLEFYASNTVEAINIEALEVAKSYTAKTVPGIRKGEGARTTHPGGWADRSGVMIISFYQSSRKLAPGVYEGKLINTTEYAVYVEALGYWVLSGLFEGVIQEIANRHMRSFVEFINRTKS